MIREDIFIALFDRLGKVYPFKEKSRRLKTWDDCEAFPAMFLHQTDQSAAKLGRGIPAVWTMQAELYLYAMVEGDRPSASVTNELLDRVEEAMTPDGFHLDNKLTLGGLVEDCFINGQVVTDEGTLGNKAVVIVPITIIVSSL